MLVTIGYLGRVAVFEVVQIDHKLQEMISNRASMETMKRYVSENDIRSLREELIDLVNQGMTSSDEAVRILYNID